MLHKFITTTRTAIIARCEEKTGARLVASRSNVTLDNAAPLFLDQLVTELRRRKPSRDLAITKSALKHGRDLLTKGFTVSQVVHEYGDICQAVTELAIEKNARIDTDDFRRLNRCLDDAIAGAVTEYGRSRDHTINRHADTEAQRLEALTRQLQTAIQIANMAREMVTTGSVGISGSTSGLLDMSLHAAAGLVDSLLAEFSAKRPAIEHSQHPLADPTDTAA